MESYKVTFCVWLLSLNISTFRLLPWVGCHCFILFHWYMRDQVSSPRSHRQDFKPGLTLCCAFLQAWMTLSLCCSNTQEGSMPASPAASLPSSPIQPLWAVLRAWPRWGTMPGLGWVQGQGTVALSNRSKSALAIGAGCGLDQPFPVLLLRNPSSTTRSSGGVWTSRLLPEGESVVCQKSLGLRRNQL